MRRQSKLFKRRADWGRDNGIHGKQDAKAVETVVHGIADQINNIKDTFKVKSESLNQFLAKNPITALFNSEDPYVKDAGRQLQRKIHGYVESFEDSVKNRFKGSKGTNTIDWICNALGQQKTSSREKRNTTGLRMQPDYGEAGSYTTEANQENAKVGSKQFVFKAKFLQK